MASLVQPDDPSSPEYRGIESIFEFTNGDGRYTRTNCGQAAAVTFLTFHGRLSPDEDQPAQIMSEIEDSYPPDNMGGAFGTSRRRVAMICRKHGMDVMEIEGEEALREHLSRRDPVIVMIGVSAGRILRYFDLPGGHWMVAYGYDQEHIYLTNHGSMTWDEFRGGWRSFVPRLISMRCRGLVAASQSSLAETFK
jgi:hypothetical protein